MSSSHQQGSAWSLYERNLSLEDFVILTPLLSRLHHNQHDLFIRQCRWNATQQQVTLSSLLEIVNSTKSADISAALKSISIDQRDALMKYIYKGLQLGGESAEGINCAVLLGWHERVCLLPPHSRSLVTAIY